MKLWQAIKRTQLSHPQVNNDEMPEATAEQVRVHTRPKRACGLNTLPHRTKPRATRRSKMWQSGLPRWAGE